MNSLEARKILVLFRPGLDEDDPQFREALAQAERDPELRAWLEQEQELAAALRRKFRAIEVPDDLLQKILLQNPAPAPRQWSPLRILQLAAALLILCGLGAFWLHQPPRNTFAGYETYLGKLVSRKYRMSLESNNPARIRSFLANNQAPSDYVLQAPLAKADPLGCATLSWNGNPVSMLCFSDHAKRKLFLFVVSRGAIPDAPPAAARRFQRIGEYAIAGWTEGNRSYVLAVQGDPELLSTYL
jgi:hypothetical protein